jgi:hypothetical protein
MVGADMSLLFPYYQVKVRRPVVPLGGRTVRPRALVRTTVIGPSGTDISDCLLDTGADDTVFPDAFASRLGLDLSNAPLGEVVGVASTPVPIRYAEVTLRLTDGREFCEWLAWVGFTAAPLRQPLLGFAGCLQFFDATFRGGREQVELVTNTLYLGRSGRIVP